MPMAPTSTTANNCAARFRPNTVCAYPGSTSEVRNARRGLIGGPLIVSVGVWGVPAAGRVPATPTRALSFRCPCAYAGMPARRPTRTRAMAGECGNRTHPTLLGRVTVILKITEATRPHPPPCSNDLDRNISPFDHFTDDHSSRYSRKIVGGPGDRHGDYQSPGRLRVRKDRAVFLASALPPHQRPQIFAVSLRSIGDRSCPHRLTHTVEDRNRVEPDSNRHPAGARDVEHMTE